MIFADRRQAGELLAKQVSSVVVSNTVIYAITRGGVVVGSQIARRYKIPIFPLVIKKLRAPTDKELAIGGLTFDKMKYVDWDVAFKLHVEQEYLDHEIQVREKEIEEAIQTYNISKLLQDQLHAPVLLIDDGIATGSTVLTALKWLKKRGSTHITLATPVVAKETYRTLQKKVDTVVALEIPDHMSSVGAYYKAFPQLTEEEVIKIIKQGT